MKPTAERPTRKGQKKRGAFWENENPASGPRPFFGPGPEKRRGIASTDGRGAGRGTGKFEKFRGPDGKEGPKRTPCQCYAHLEFLRPGRGRSRGKFLERRFTLHRAPRKGELRKGHVQEEKRAIVPRHGRGNHQVCGPRKRREGGKRVDCRGYVGG